jgi:outer membrane protein insertion porin family
MNFRSLSPVFVALATLLLLLGQSGAQAPVGPIVRSIDVQYAGASTVSREKVLANMQTRVGRPYDERTVEDDIRNLYATGNIVNVRIYGEPVADGVKVIVVLQSKAQISEVIVNGVTQLKPGRIRKEISSKPGDSLNEATLEADRQKVLEYYANKGFTEADVRYTVDANERTGSARVVFEVNEGGKVAIRSVKFEGNTAVRAATCARSSPRVGAACSTSSAKRAG